MAESPNNVELNGEKEREAEPEGPRSFFQLHPKAKLALLLLGLSLAIGGFFAWRHYSTRESTDDAQIDGNIYPISSRINGHVTAVEVENNEFVKKGAVLVQVDPTDYNVALERAEANYATALARAQASQVGVPITSVNSASGISSAQARVEQARAAISAAQEQYQAAESKVKQMQADYARAKSDLARYALLIKKDEISRQQYDHAVQAAQSDSAAVAATQSSASAAEQQVSQARALLSQAQADLRASRTGPQRIRVSRAEAAAAEAAVKTAKASLDQAQLNVDYTTVRAPADGIVGKKSVEVGQNIAAGQALMAIVPIAGLYVTANYKETELKDMRPGDPATIHVDAYGRDYKGHVLNVAGATGEKFSLLPPENATGNYVKVVQRIPVKIVFDPGQDREHLLRIGMSVEPTVITKK
ncbi:MAG: HlyD family secretion protein [Acidobacteria bacterium]|nr:HlyD family secretion protein [Acidobacteriota bacterium]